MSSSCNYLDTKNVFLYVFKYFFNIIGPALSSGQIGGSSKPQWKTDETGWNRAGVEGQHDNFSMR